MGAASHISSCTFPGPGGQVCQAGRFPALFSRFLSSNVKSSHPSISWNMTCAPTLPSCRSQSLSRRISGQDGALHLHGFPPPALQLQTSSWSFPRPTPGGTITRVHSHPLRPQAVCSPSSGVRNVPHLAAQHLLSQTCTTTCTALTAESMTSSVILTFLLHQIS